MYQLLNILVYLCFLIVSNVSGQNEMKLQKCTSNSYLTIDITNGIKENTTNNIIFENVTYTENDYFIANQENSSELQIFGCLCNIQKCVRKCCPLGQSFTNNKCQNTTDPLAVNFTIPVYDKTNEIIVDDDYFKYIYNTDFIYENYILAPIIDNIYLQRNGTLYIPNNSYSININQDDVCFEITQNDNFEIVFFKYIYLETTIDHSVDHLYKFFFYLYIAELSLGSLLFFIIFLVHVCIPELRNFYGKCVICYTATQFCSGVLIIFLCHTLYCGILAHLFYFLLLSSLMWSNVICIDIYWTFSGRGGVQKVLNQTKSTKFTIYSIYAWGFPLLMNLIVVTIQFTPNVPDYIKPQYDQLYCWLPTDLISLICYYSPILIITVINMVLFAYTTIIVCKHQRIVEKGINKDSQRHVSVNDTTQRYVLYRFLLIFCLYCIISLNWLVDLLPYLFFKNWLAVRILESVSFVYGIYIFIIWVRKENIWKLICTRYQQLMNKLPAQTNVSTTLSQNTINTLRSSIEVNMHRF